MTTPHFTPEVQRLIDRMNALAGDVQELIEELKAGTYTFDEGKKVAELERQLQAAASLLTCANEPVYRHP